jgi:hypothetical protein
MSTNKPTAPDLRSLPIKKLREEVERTRLIAEANTYQMLSNSGWGAPTMSELGYPGPGFVVGQPYRAGGYGSTDGEFFANEREYLSHVTTCRRMYGFNPFARNIVENLTSYIAGAGFTYKVTPKIAEDERGAKIAAEAQKWIDEYRKANGTAMDEQESVRRGERDGEVVVAFYGEEGVPTYRFRDPHEMQTPAQPQGKLGEVSFGIDFASGDAKTVLGYYLGGKRFEPGEVEHVKMNADFNAPRGVSSLFGVGEFLTNAVTSIGFVTKTANFQSSIGMIRRHKGSMSEVAATLLGKADRTITKTNGEQRNQFDVRGNRIIDASENTEIEFPGAMVDVAKMVEAVQANLRAAASGVLLPEWMVTGKLDGKYSNAEISEGPTGFMVNRKQAVYTGLWHRMFVSHLLPGEFEEADLALIDVQVIAPQTGQGMTLEEAQVAQVLVGTRALSITTLQAQAGLDPARENRQIQEEEDRALGVGAPANPNQTGQ